MDNQCLFDIVSVISLITAAIYQFYHDLITSILSIHCMYEWFFSEICILYKEIDFLMVRHIICGYTEQKENSFTDSNFYFDHYFDSFDSCDKGRHGWHPSSSMYDSYLICLGLLVRPILSTPTLGKSSPVIRYLIVHCTFLSLAPIHPDKISQPLVVGDLKSHHEGISSLFEDLRFTICRQSINTSLFF